MALSSAEAYIKLKDEISELLNDVGQSLASLLDAPAADGHAEAHIDLTQQLGAFFAVYYQVRKRLERDALSVAVLALTKSGKSTLINAFLGNEILPVNNVPETARICRIKHVPAASCPEPVLELSASGVGTSRTSSLASAGSASYDATGFASSPSISSSSDGGCSSQRSSMEHAEGETLIGAAAIREHLQQLNRDVRAREHMRNDEKILNISAPLVVLDGAGGASPASPDDSSSLSSIQLCLLDTPGPNEAGEEGLKYQVERLLGRVDAAIYLLDYTKLKTAEEAAVLSRLKAINPALVRRLCSRLFFAVNKMDQADESCGLDDDETRQYVAEIITQQLNCPDFKLHPDQVLLLSARDALLSRLILNNRSDPANTQRFCRVAFGAYNPTRPRARNAPAASSATPSNSLAGAGGRSLDELRAAAGGLLEGSGVPELEERVLGYLCEAAGGVKLVALLDDTDRLLTEVSNVSCSCRAALAASSSALADKTSALQSRLTSTLNHFDTIMEGTADLQVEVTDELRAHLGNLRTRLFQYIYNALDPDTLRTNQAAADATAAAAAGEEPGCSSSSSSHHHRHRRGHGCCHSRHRRRCGSSTGSSSHFYSSMGEAAGSNGCYGFAATAAAFAAGVVPPPPFAAGVVPPPPPPAAAAAAGAGYGSGGVSSGGGWWGLRERALRLFGRLGGGGGMSESKDELSSALMDLSEDIMTQIQGEVSEAWHVMEGATNERAARLTASLNTHIQQLSAQLEGAVNEALQIQLEPVTLHMAAPDAVQFHADLTDLIERGIRHQQTRHVRTGERTDFVMEERRGACRLTNYYIQVPRRRRIIETYTATTYSLAPDAVLDHFMGVVDEAISTTERHLPAYVKEYIRRQVEQARTKVQDYGNRYIDSLSAALEAASAGAEARQAALDQVQAYCTAFDALRARLAALQTRAELLVPHNTASGCGLFEQVPEYEEEEEEEEEDGSQQDMEQQQQQQEEEVMVEDSSSSSSSSSAAVVGNAVEAEGVEQQLQEALVVPEGGEVTLGSSIMVAATAAAAAATAAGLAAAAATAEEVAAEVVPSAAAAASSSSVAELDVPTAEDQPAVLEAADSVAGDDASAADAGVAPDAAAEQLTAEAAAEDAAAAVEEEEEAGGAPAADLAASGAGSAATAAAGGSASGSSSFFGALASWMGGRDSSTTTMIPTTQQQEQQGDQQVVEEEETSEDSEEEGAAVVGGMSAVPTLQELLMAEDVAGATTAAADDTTAAAVAAAVQQGDEAGSSSSLQRARDRARERVAARGVQVNQPEEVEVLDLTVDDDSGSTNADDVVAATAAEGAATGTAAAAAGGSDGSVDDADGGTGMDAMMVTLDHSSSEDMCDVESETDSQSDAVADAAAAPAADKAAEAAAPAAAAISPLSSADSGDSSAGSAVSAAETAVSDTFSLMSGAATESSAFSGMTAGTAFTLQSSSSGSGVSKMQEHLADSLLGALPAVHPTQQDTTPPPAAAAACGVDGVGEEGVVGVCQGAEEVAVDGVSSSSNTREEAAAVAVPTGAESLYASMYGSGLLLSADDIQGALQMAALPAADTDAGLGAAAADTAASSSAGVVTTVTAADIAGAATAAPPPAAAAAAGSGSSSAAVEGWQGDASLYASIIAHSEDHEQPGSPFNFGESFAAALTAAGLDSLSGPSPPSGSPRESDDWQIVEAEEEGGAAGGPVVAEAGAEGASSSSSGGGGGSRLGRSWMGGRGTA